jgi:hypothetical protein
MSDDLIRELFHCCALTAWIQIAHETGRWPPDSNLTNHRACQLYEEALSQERQQLSNALSLPRGQLSQKCHTQPEMILLRLTSVNISKVGGNDQAK